MWLWLEDLYVVVDRGLVCGNGSRICMLLKDLYVTRLLAYCQRMCMWLGVGVSNLLDIGGCTKKPT